MALEEGDLMAFKYVVEEAVKPLTKRIDTMEKEHGESIRSLNQSIHGVNGENGLYRTVKDQGKKLSWLQKIVYTGAGALGAIKLYLEYFNKH